MSYLYIIIGSGVGGVARFTLSRYVMSSSASFFPLGTLCVNLCGSFLIGFLSGIFELAEIPSNMRLLIMVGFLGGFTTFSTFSLETFNLLRNGEFRITMINILLNNLGAIALVIAGYFLSKFIFHTIK